MNDYRTMTKSQFEEILSSLEQVVRYSRKDTGDTGEYSDAQRMKDLAFIHDTKVLIQQRIMPAPVELKNCETIHARWA